MAVGGSRLRRAARKICGCGGGESFNNDDPVVVIYNNTSSNISRSSTAVSAKPIKESPTTTLTLTNKMQSTCAICLETLVYNTPGVQAAIFTAECGHGFHFTCISSNVRHGSVTCPICRAHWTQVPRDLNPPSNKTDPILGILDDSIATFRVHRRSAHRYDDDDPIEPSGSSPGQNRLQFALVPLPHHHHHLSVKLAQEAATDLVLVASPNGPHLRLLKQTMALVVFSLRSIDRLAIVTYSSTATRAFPLRRMTCQGKRTALQVIERLFYMGDAHPGPGLNKGIKILEDRAHKNPQSTILHLSDTPTASYHQLPFPTIHQFHVCGVPSSSTTGFDMQDFEEFLARILGGIIKDVYLRIGQDGEVVSLGELRGGEERRIPLYSSHGTVPEFISVIYSYIEGGGDDCLRRGQIEVTSPDHKSQTDHHACGREAGGGRVGRTWKWDYHDPYMARRWAKHLHGYRL